MDAPSTWLSTKDAARYLGINLRTLYRFIDEGELPAYRFGRVIRLKASDLEHFVEAARIPPAASSTSTPSQQARTRHERRPPVGSLVNEAGPNTDGCLFCGIIAGSIPSQRVGESSHSIAIEDVAPVAPVHLLVLPKEHRDDASVLGPEDGDVLADMVALAGRCAKEKGIATGGYRLVFNVGDDAGNTVAHLHLHVIGGRQLSWPPG